MSERGSRASSLSPPEFYLLRQWGNTLHRSFGAMTYLVGSVARGETWRDVDMRMMLPDEHPLLALGEGTKALNVAMSIWGQRATGLPIDFQFQSITEGNSTPEPRRRLPMWVPAVAAESEKPHGPPDDLCFDPEPPDDGICTECYEWRRYPKGQEHFGYAWWRRCDSDCGHAHHEDEVWLAAESEKP